ncbi:uncharacterized protein LOC122522763 [Polistes fuscatus]|uniref:uncharacterized protein LOC122522763 n=1 Tax=Polistes fuscatus TaxID=30207 RepID=UPI001CA8DD97|nr:uncharacterized protein LOC122522763 [Polistes fuscatus]
MAQLKVTLETSADEQEVGREELNEKAVENTSLRRRVERKRQDKAVEEEAVTYTYEQIDSMKLRELKEAAKKLRLSTVLSFRILTQIVSISAVGCSVRRNVTASINCVQSITDRVAIRINCLLAYALLDTGSEVSIINSELYNKLRRPRLCETTRRLAGFDTDEIDVKEPYKVRIKELIQNYKPNTKPDARTETKIKLTENIPVCSEPRRLAPKEKKIVTQQLNEWLYEGIIKPSTSEYSSPVVVVPKKDGTYKVCIDYRKLNAKVIRDRFPMLLIEDCLDALTQGVIEEDSRKFTSFVTPDGQFEFLRTPFGFCSSLASFLRFIDEVFGDLVRKKIVLTYMDDLIIPGIDYEESCRKLEITLTVAAQNGLIINWKKCKFLREEIEFLGHVVWNGSIRPLPTKIKALQRFSEPKNRKQIQSFLGLTGYFRKFIKDYAKIARPLSDLLKAEPVLRIYDPGAMTELHTDASIDGFGAVLLQKYDNENNYPPVHYMSYKTSEAKRRYHSYELEVLAIIKAVQKFRVYLLGIRFKCKRNNRYEVIRVGGDEGPKITTTAADYMKPFEEFSLGAEGDADCSPSCLINIMSCFSGYPFFVNLPNFYKADPILRNQIVGMSHSKENHSNRVILDPKESIIVPILKKVTKTEPKNNSGISLLSAVKKVITKIFAKVIEGTETSEKQQDFRQNRSTVNVIFILRQIAKKAIEFYKTIYMSFVDLQIAFDNVKLRNLLQILRA